VSDDSDCHVIAPESRVQSLVGSQNHGQRALWEGCEEVSHVVGHLDQRGGLFEACHANADRHVSRPLLQLVQPVERSRLGQAAQRRLGRGRVDDAPA